MVTFRRQEGKVALVTGGGAGIGRACCERLSAEGAAVGILDIDLAAAQAVERDLRARGGDALAVRVDVADRHSVFAALKAVVERFGRLDVAVNNAGIGGTEEPLADMPFEVWDRTIAINLSGVYYAMRAEYPAMAAGGGGAIINIASILGTVGYAEAAPYVASKHGVVGLTRSAALSWGADNIRVTAVCPTFVRTALTSNLPEEGWPELVAKHPLGRLPVPEEVAAMVAFLASDEARSVTGSVHHVDAGYTAS